VTGKQLQLVTFQVLTQPIHNIDGKQKCNGKQKHARVLHALILLRSTKKSPDGRSRQKWTQKVEMEFYVGPT